MTAKRAVEDYLSDIVAYSDKAMAFLADLPSADALERDERTLLAVIRALEVIGEAARQLPPAFRAAHPEVPWRAMTGTRDKVIHGYFGVDTKVIWKTVKEDLPPVREAVSRLLAEISASGQADQGPS